VYSQDNLNTTIESKADSIVYNKNTNISLERTFSSGLNEKYSGKDFVYIEDTSVKKKESKPIDTGFLEFFIFFMSKIFPFLLGGFIIFVILKTVVGFDVGFWKPKKSIKKRAEKLIYEDEDIHEIDLESLLKQAINNQNFRLAIRYYYLTSLKGLSTKKIIDYHKDKTNSEYLFEITNTETRNHFSYLSYVYTYVWYGEFPIDQQGFETAQNKYQSFIKNIH
jgi:hypothetical protein